MVFNPTVLMKHNYTHQLQSPATSLPPLVPQYSSIITPPPPRNRKPKTSYSEWDISSAVVPPKPRPLRTRIGPPFLWRILFYSLIGWAFRPSSWVTSPEPQSPPSGSRRYLSAEQRLVGPPAGSVSSMGSTQGSSEATYCQDWNPWLHDALQVHLVSVDYMLPSYMLLRGRRGSTEYERR